MEGDLQKSSKEGIKKKKHGDKNQGKEEEKKHHR